jgi:uncharacterized protein YuzE
MKLTYDTKYNIAYIQLRPKRGKVRTVQVSDELNVDLAADGSIYGIELLNANEQLAADKGVIVENRASRTRRKISLVA